MILELGDRGTTVRQLQQALQIRGFDIIVDGIFGKGTRRAVRTFQERNGLVVDGIAGSNTMAALGLDLDNGADNEGNVQNIEFILDETEVPERVQARIDTYVENLQDQHEKLLQVMRDALHQFGETMESPSTADANPDILGTLLSSAFDGAVGEVIRRAGGTIAPGLAFVKAAWDGVSQELERAGQAAVGLSISNWIKDQRVIIDEKARVDWDGVREEISLAFLEAENRQQFSDELFEANQRLQDDLIPAVSALELKLYEQWINAHFKGIADDMPGCVEFRYKFEDNIFDFVSCTVEAPAGDHIETALNRLLRQDLVSEFERPLDLNVRKRACFFVENLMPGGHSWACGWLDRENNLIHQPILEDAQQAIQDQAWRMATRKFDRG